MGIQTERRAEMKLTYKVKRVCRMCKVKKNTVPAWDKFHGQAECPECYKLACMTKDTAYAIDGPAFQEMAAELKEIDARVTSFLDHSDWKNVAKIMNQSSRKNWIEIVKSYQHKSGRFLQQRLNVYFAILQGSAVDAMIEFKKLLEMELK